MCALDAGGLETCACCSSLPPEPLPTAITFIILQHPAEHKRRITGTMPLILQCLSNCRRMVMHVGGLQPTEDDLRDILGLGSRKDDDTDSAFSSSGTIPLLLFPCAEAEFIEVNENEHAKHSHAHECDAVSLFYLGGEFFILHSP
ncbi:unnamed protein product [Sphacelaria rigidula]